MEITIIKKNQLNVVTLPKTIQGSSWLTDYENGKKINLINIEAVDDKWQMNSNENVFVIDGNDVMVPSVVLKEYSFYLLNDVIRKQKYYVYCAPVYENNYMELAFSDKQTIKVGKDSKCDISYQLNGISNNAFSIVKKENGFYIELNDKDVALYINKQRVFGNRKISYGDVLFIYGLKIILMKKDGVDYLLVNNPQNLIKYNASIVQMTPVKNDFIDNHEVLNDDTMLQKDNFYRTPRFYREFEVYNLKIDAPPTKKEGQEVPLALTIGPMLTMSTTSVMMLLSQFQAVASGEKDFSSSLTGMITAGVMLASCLLWPLLTKMYQKSSDKRYEKKRQRQYKKYVDKKEEEISKELENQRNALIDNYFSISKCQEVISNKEILLWQRRITDKDFLKLPVGFGNLPMNINISYPEETFTLEEDNLLDMVHNLGSKKRILRDVPITYSFYDNAVTGIVGDYSYAKRFADNLILQIMANYSFDEVKVVTFTSTDNESQWDYVKTIPHSWSNDKEFRFFGSSNDDYREMIYILEKIFQERKNTKEALRVPHYVIVTDVIKSIDSYDFIKNVLSSSENLGFSIVMLVDKISALPNECKDFIEVSNAECNIFENQLNLVAQPFQMDKSPIDDIYSCAEELANIPLDIKTEVESNFADMYQFLEMYQVGKVNQLNSLERWKKNNPVLSLQAPIGVGKNGEIITLDLHEKYHGPHGLIAGTTGSGKSEFIISYVLSLAVNYHPYEVQMILIDYKGGSLAGAFVNDQYRLPHVAGTITNLDGNELNRSLASIESEVTRRQKEFNAAKKIANESTMDIYKYQKLFREGKLQDMGPIAHLFIISDEFAELKEQQPEFMDKLISVARVGRSLGVHLILATQKPGGVVNAQIWSNTRFRVCLKVQDTSDSQEVLKKPDAAFLKKTGRFYLQVGYDEIYTLGQAAWAGGQYYPSTTFKKEVDTSINTINNIGYVISTKESENQENVLSEGEELPNIVSYLSNLANSENIHVKKLWLDKIPAKIYIDSLIKKYSFKCSEYVFNPVIGEYDDPAKQNQYLLTLPMYKDGNALIYGIAGSGKEQFITSVLYSSMVSYKPEEVNFYILDFGAETLTMFSNSPYVGDVVLQGEVDKVRNLFKMIEEELNNRKKLFANYGGTYASYIKSGSTPLANIVVVINNFEAFSENYDDYLDSFASILREAYKYGIYFIITASTPSAVRSKVKQSIGLTYVLEQISDSDYSAILGNCRGKIPSKARGRGLFKSDNVYEFQTASVIRDDEQVSVYIQKVCQALQEKTSYRAKRIPILPEVVDYDVIYPSLDHSMNLVVGVNHNTLELEKFNISKNVLNLVTGNDLDEMHDFVVALFNQIQDIDLVDNIILNSLDYDYSNESFANKVFSSSYDIVIDKIYTYINKVYDLYVQSNYNIASLAKCKKMICSINGLSGILSRISSESKKKWEEMIIKCKEVSIVSFVIIDTHDNLKKYSFEEWFKTSSDLSKGIFYGNGISEQMLFRVSRISREDREELPSNYGFVIRSSKLFKTKFLSSYRKND